MTPGRRNNRIVALVSIGVAILVLAALAAFIIFGSNATVTIIVPTQPSAPLNLQYVASTNPNDTIHSTILSQVLTPPPFTATSAPGQGTATGVTQQGNTNATGTVIFTNKGTQSVVIPTGTVIQTGGAAAVQFVTTVNVLVLPASTNGYTPPPVKVQAQNPGTSATPVPKPSVILTVTNPSPTSGGGAANVKQVTPNDADALRKALHPDLQKKINSWLATLRQQGDVPGKPIPDVLGSSTPLPEETLTQVGQPSAGGTFTGVLSVSVKILDISAATIQDVSKAQLKMKMKPAPEARHHQQRERYAFG